MKRILIFAIAFAFSSFAATAPKGPFTTLDGKALALFADGKPVLLDFWASWCIPCRFAVPELNQIAMEHPSMHIVGVNADDPGNFDQAKRFMQATKMAYPSIVDIPEQISNHLQVDALPTLILFDGKGKELRRWIGAPQDLREQIRKSLPNH